MKCQYFVLIFVILSVCRQYYAKKSGSSSTSSASSSNSGDPGNHSSHSSSSVTSKCNNGVCKTCVGKKCYDRGFSKVTAQAGCPAAACDEGCSDFVIHTDDCPICKCDGFATREPCNSQSECGSGGKCENNVCKYPPVPDDAPTACSSTRECKATQKCSKGKCVASKEEHVPETFCVFHHQCPDEFSCSSDSTCVKTGMKHGTKSCVFETDCESDEECKGMTCIKT